MNERESEGFFLVVFVVWGHFPLSEINGPLRPEGKVVPQIPWSSRNLQRVCGRQLRGEDFFHEKRFLLAQGFPPFTERRSFPSKWSESIIGWMLLLPIEIRSLWWFNFSA